MASNKSITVVVDIGTSKIVALAGFMNEQGKIEIIGRARVSSKGIKRGLVFNIEEVSGSLNILFKKLQSQLDVDIENVHVAFAGQNMKIVDYQGYRFTSDEGVVSSFDLNELYNEAENHKVEKDYKIIHIIPQCYKIDDENVEMNPVGITGRKIEASYKLITVPVSQLTNINRVFEKLDVRVENVSFAPIALAEAVLTNDEKELGSVVLDIGSGTTSLAVYFENVLVHTALIPFGGHVISKDIKEGYSILLKWAEQLKVRYGEALGDQANENKMVTIPAYNGWEPKEISCRSLAFIIQARMEEIIDSVHYQIEKSNVKGQLGSGIVVTGGTSKLQNLVPLIKFRTGMDARLAFPVIHPANTDKEFQNHDLYIALGLLKIALNKNNAGSGNRTGRIKKKKGSGGLSPLFNKVVQGMLNLVDDENEDVELN